LLFLPCFLISNLKIKKQYKSYFANIGRQQVCKVLQEKGVISAQKEREKTKSLSSQT